MFVSCSLHGKNDFRRVRNLNAQLVFISPLFITESNRAKTPLGLHKISLLANFLKYQYCVLGGINDKNIRTLRNRGITSISGLNYIQFLDKK